MVTGAAAIGTDGRVAPFAVGGIVVGGVSAARVTVSAIPGVECDVGTLTVVAGEGLLNDLEVVAEATGPQRMGQWCAGIPLTEPLAQDVRMGDIRSTARKMG